MSKRKNPRSNHSASNAPSARVVCASPARGRGYPTIASLLAGVGLAVVGTGCEPPQCQPTRLDEVRVHGDTALTDVGGFQLKDAANELGVGFGIVPHPAIMAPGMMMPVSAVPIPSPPPAPPSSDVDS